MIQENKDKLPYMLQRLPDFFKEELPKSRDEALKKVMDILESALKSNDFEQLIDFPYDFEVMHRVYGFKKEEKQKIFLLILHFLGQPYFYLTLNMIRQKIFLCFVWILKLTSSAFEGEKLHIDWKHIFNMMEQVFLENRYNLQLNGDIDKLIFFKHFLNFLEVVKPFFPDESVKEIYHKSQERFMYVGMVTLKQFLKISHKVPGETYWPLIQEIFQLWQLRNFKPFEDTFYYIVSSVICRHPQLPWHEYYDFLFSKFYREAIQILPVQDSKYGYVTKQVTVSPYNKFPSTQRVIGQTLANLLLPTHGNNSEIVWDQLVTIFNMLRFLLHPNNQQVATQKVLQLYYYFLSQFVQRYSREQMQKKRQLKKDKKEEENEFAELQEEDVKLDKEEQQLQGLENVEESVLDEEDQSDDESIEIIDCYIDQTLINKVIELYMNDVNHMLYLKEYKEKSVQQIIRLLVALSPSEVIAKLLEIIDRAFARQDMKYNTIIEVLGSIIPFLLDRKACPEGLNYLPAILRTLSVHITAHDANQSYNIWRLFDIVLQYVPVYDIDDLVKEFDDLDSRMPLEAQQLTEEISSIVLEAFRKFLALFEFLSKKKRDSTRHFRTLFISISNKFYNLIAQSSKSIFKELLRITCDYMEEKLQPHVQQYFAQLLQAFSQRDPKLTLETFFPLISEKLLKKQTVCGDIKHFKFLEPIQYEFQVTHQQTLLYYLSLTEELVGYSHHYCSIFDAELTAIVQLCLQHEEIQVFNQGVQIITQMLLGLVSVHPQDVSFRDDGKIDLDWMSHTSKQFKKNFTVKWWQPGPEDKKYLQTLLDKFYYPIMNFLLTFTSQQNVVVNDFSSYVTTNFLEIVHQLNEPYCSQTLQTDIFTRSEIFRAFTLICQQFSVIQLRCREAPQSIGYKRFQDWICFDELNEEFSKIRQLVIQFFPVLVKSGLARDSKITSSYSHLLFRMLGRHTKDHYNIQLVMVRKWVLQRGLQFKNPITKRGPISRFMKVVLAAYNLNVRMLGVQHMQDKVDEEYIQILLCLGFHAESQKTAFIYLGYLSNTSVSTNVAVTAAVSQLLNGRLFSKDELSKVQGSTLQKLGLFQKVVAQACIRYVDYLSHQVDFKMDILSMFSTLSRAFDSLIDKTFKNTFNLILVKFLEHMFKVIQRKSTCKIMDQVEFIQTSIQYMEVYTERAEYLKTMPFLKDQQDTYTFCASVVQNTVELLQKSDGNLRNKIVNGLILLFVPPVQSGDKTEFLQFSHGVNDVAIDFVVSDEFAYRSFGRTLLFKIVRLAKMVNSVRVDMRYTKEDFKQGKTFEQYQLTRYFRDEDYSKSMVKNASKKSVYTYYTDYIFNEVHDGDLQVTLQRVRQAFSGKEYCTKFVHGILNDLQANEDNQSLFQQQITDYSSVFHDVAKFFNSQVNGNLKRENLFYKNLTVQYEYLKRLFKKLFQFTDYQFFKNTKDLVVTIAQKGNDKDSQMLARLYILALLKAVHSKWPLPQDLDKEQIIDYALLLINQNIETSAKDQFFQIQIGLMMVSFDSDSRYLDYFVTQVIQKTKEQTKELLIIRYIGLITSIQKCTGFRGITYSKQISDAILPILYQTQDSRTVQAVVNLFISEMKDLYSFPTNTTLIKELYDITTIPKDFVAIKNTVYVLQHSKEFQTLMEYMCGLLRSPVLEQRKLAFDSVAPLVELMKYEDINEFQLQYYGGLIEYLLDFKEEDIQNEQTSLQFTQHALHIGQLVYDESAFQQVIEYARKASKSKQFKTRLRVLRFLTHFLYNNIKCDKVQFIEEFSFLLEDEQKLVQDQARNFITALVTTLLPHQQSELVDLFIKKANVPLTELQGKAGLIGLIYSLQNLTTSWSNRALGVVLSGKSRAPQIKEFAAYFQKLYKANYLSEELTYPLDQEITEKLAEYASPYNYFA